jgi:hypothetical protein
MTNISDDTIDFLEEVNAPSNLIRYAKGLHEMDYYHTDTRRKTKVTTNTDVRLYVDNLIETSIINTIGDGISEGVSLVTIETGSGYELLSIKPILSSLPSIHMYDFMDRINLTTFDHRIYLVSISRISFKKTYTDVNSQTYDGLQLKFNHPCLLYPIVLNYKIQ